MMRTKQRSSQCRVPRASLLLTLTTVILFSCSQSLAQQRDGNPTNADSNSSSASSGRVNFNIIQLMNGEYLEMFGTGTGRGLLRGHPTISGIELGSLSADPLMFSTNSVERMRIASNGNVGIGTTTPEDAFHVFNTTNTVGTMRLQGGPTYAGFIGVWEGDPSLLLTNNRHPGTGNNYNPAGIGAQLFLRGGEIHFYTTASGTVGTVTELMRIKANGNVGIGVAIPSAKLHVFGVSTAGTAVFGGTTLSSHFNYNGDNSEDTYIRGGKSTSRVIVNDFSTGNVLVAQGGGNVGIGTGTPARKLEIFHDVAGISFEAGTGSPNSGVIRFGDSSGWKLHFGRSRNGGALNSGTAGVLMTVQDNGNVGIGTMAPGHKLEVAGTIRSSNGGFVFPDGTVQTTASGGPSSQWTTSGVNIFYNSGNVGIGAPIPGAKLEVVGNVNVTGTGNITASGTIEGGNIKAKYQDVAEWVESSQEIVAGTVVVLDSSKSNQVIASTQSYDSRVAGVISRQPGLTLGEAGEGRVLVATTGRVKVKVDATNGPVQIGDLLVTSNREGFAMKSLPVDIGGVRMHRPGTLIGKALEPLKNGTGEILVLLSLQ